jgi:hypothetical protein
MAKAQRSTPTRRPNRAQRRRALAAGAAAVFPEPAAPPAVETVRELLPAIAAPPAPEAPEEQIRALAFAIYLGRRGTPGRQVDDWLEAERRLRAG